jgi:hypothetical protein
MSVRPAFPPCGLGRENFVDFIAHLAKCLQDFLFGSLCMSWVLEGRVVALFLAWILGSDLIGVTANGDHGVDFLLEKFIHVLTVMCAQVNADFLHHLLSKGMHIARWIRACALQVEDMASCIA